MPKRKGTFEVCEFDEAGRLTATYVQSPSGNVIERKTEARVDVIVRIPYLVHFLLNLRYYALVKFIENAWLAS